MKILIVAATAHEIAPIIKASHYHSDLNERLTKYSFGPHQLYIMITGVGMVQTAYWCGKIMSWMHFDLALNLGIAGSFNNKFEIGSVVNVITDEFSELAIEDNDKLLSLDEAGLKTGLEFPGKNLILNNPNEIPVLLENIPVVKGITVNTVHGNAESIKLIISRYHPDIETMEGAAFMYAAMIEQIKFIQLRAISNYVEPRNKENWNIPLAIQQLNMEALRYISEL